MRYTSERHVDLTPKPEYPKQLHDGKGGIMHALNAEHEAELRSQGYSHKAWDRDVHGKAVSA